MREADIQVWTDTSKCGLCCATCIWPQVSCLLRTTWSLLFREGQNSTAITSQADQSEEGSYSQSPAIIVFGLLEFSGGTETRECISQRRFILLPSLRESIIALSMWLGISASQFEVEGLEDFWRAISLQSTLENQRIWVLMSMMNDPNSNTREDWSSEDRQLGFPLRTLWSRLQPLGAGYSEGDPHHL